MKIDGEDVLLKIWIHHIIGDAVGNNELCGHSNGSSSSCLSKDCKCKKNELALIPRRCKKVTIRDMMEVKVNEKFAHSLSKYSIHNAFDGLPLSDFRYGILGITPFERLHMLASGVIEHCFTTLRDMIGEGKSNASEKGDLDDLFDVVRNDLSKQSSRDNCRSSGRFGVMDMTRVTAMERVGNFFIFLICLNTVKGRALLSKCLDDYNTLRQKQLEDAEKRKEEEVLEGEPDVSSDDEQENESDQNTPLQREPKIVTVDDVLETMEWLLSFFVWMHDSHSRGHLRAAQPMVERLLGNIFDYFPREKISKKEKELQNRSGSGSRGWEIVKFHAISGVVQDLLDFGNGLSFAGDCGEKFHQYVVKSPGFQTQKRCNTFTAQVAKNVFAADVINYAYSHSNVGNHIMFGKADQIGGPTPFRERGNDFYTLPDNLNNVKLLGKYTAIITHSIERGMHRYKFDPRWADAGKELLKHPLSREFVYHIAHSAERKKYYHDFTIEGFTELRHNGQIYRASEYYRGCKWYDWAHVLDPKDGLEMQGRILGFFRYKTPGFPTRKLAEDDGLSQAIIERDQMTDDTAYMIFHACNDWCSREELESKMCKKITLECGDRFTYILPVTSIRGPVAVIPNYGSCNGSLDYITALPYHKWGLIFSEEVEKMR